MIDAFSREPGPNAATISLLVTGIGIMNVMRVGPHWRTPASAASTACPGARRPGIVKRSRQT
jgi:hypothetical protein